MDFSAFSFSITTLRSSFDFTSPPGHPIQKLSMPLPANALTRPPAEEAKLMSLRPPLDCLIVIDTGSRLATISRRPLLSPPLILASWPEVEAVVVREVEEDEVAEAVMRDRGEWRVVDGWFEQTDAVWWRRLRVQDDWRVRLVRLVRLVAVS